MFDPTARTFLQQPLTARMAVIDSTGCPHVVPVWFMLDGDDVVIISDRDTRKVDYIRANPKGAVTVGGDPGQGQGYLMKGEFVLEEDTDLEWLKKMTRHYEEGEEAEKDIAAWSELDMIVLRLKVRTVIKVI